VRVREFAGSVCVSRTFCTYIKNNNKKTTNTATGKNIFLYGEPRATHRKKRNKKEHRLQQQMAATWRLFSLQVYGNTINLKLQTEQSSLFRPNMQLCVIFHMIWSTTQQLTHFKILLFYYGFKCQV